MQLPISVVRVTRCPFWACLHACDDTRLALDLIVQENKLLTMYELGGIPSLKAGEPRINATIGMDINGIISVTVLDTSDGAGNTITPYLNLRCLGTDRIANSSSAEKAMQLDDNTYAARVDARSKLEDCFCQVKAAVRSRACKLDSGTREAVEIEMEKVVPYLAFFPLLAATQYQEALAEFGKEAALAVLGPPLAPSGDEEPDQEVANPDEAEQL